MPDVTTVPFDLYRDIHKAIRTTMFDLVADAGRVDPSDREARVALAARVTDLVDFLVFHAEHEDTHIDAAIAEVLPDEAAAITAAHVDLEAQMLLLKELAGLALGDGEDPRAEAHVLYLELARFTSAYLAHQDVEERVVMPALWAAYGIEPLLAIHGAILASIGPDDMAWSLARMLPAMNVEDRVEMLAGMRAEAPPEAFAGVLGLAAEVLRPSDNAQLLARLDAVPVG